MTKLTMGLTRNHMETIVRWFTGGACNLSCPYCVNDQLERAATWTQTEVGLAVDLVNALAPVATLMLIGGEPTCIAWLPTAVRQLRGVRRVEVLTNGLLVDNLTTLTAIAADVAKWVDLLITVHPAAWTDREQLMTAVDKWMALEHSNVHVQIKCLLTSVDDEHACTVNALAAELVPTGHLLAVARRVPSHGPTMREVTAALRGTTSPRLRKLLTARATMENRACPYAGQACPVAGKVANITPWGVSGVKCGAVEREIIPWSTPCQELVLTLRRQQVLCPERQQGCDCDATVDTEIAEQLGLRDVNYNEIDA